MKKHNDAFSVPEKEWFELQGYFFGMLNSPDSNWTKEQKERKAVELGIEYDKKFEERVGIEIEKWILDNKDAWKAMTPPRFYSTFKNLVNKKLKRPLTTITTEKKLAVRLSNHGVANRGLSFAMLRNAQRVEVGFEMEMDYRTLWLADCLGAEFLKTKELVESNEWDLLETRMALRERAKYLQDLLYSNPTAYRDEVTKIYMTNYTIRRRLRKPNLRNVEIHRLVRKFARTLVDSKQMYTNEKNADGTDLWLPCGELDVMCSVDYIQTNRRLQRSGEKEVAYEFHFNRTPGLAFLKNLESGYYDLFPPGFYDLKPGSQLIYRSIAWTGNTSNVSLDELCYISGVSSENITVRRNYIHGFLIQLHARKYLARADRYSIPGSGEDRYKLTKHQKLPVE